jgi:energy-coupling factor transporter ATP-binding protein EcfA2
MSSSRKRGIAFSTEQLAFVERKMREVGIESRESLANSSQLSVDVIKKLFRGDKIDRSTVEAVSKILGIQPTEVITPEEWYPRSKNTKTVTSEDYWRETCRELLNQWKGLTTNVLTISNGVRFQLDEMFVPLGAVERRQKTRYHSDGGSPEQGAELYEESVTPISQNAFFEQVLQQGQSKNSQGKRVAIIGEPGAGKTTQLQKIGDWILKETDGIPIWISLSALGTRSLKEYLLNQWLQTATSELEISQSDRDELGQLLKTGRVWLLLDAVDEMTIADALHQIAIQMNEGWLRNVRVVLTCRLNVWDAGKNALDRFDVYRNLDFEYPGEVHQFIDRWFATAPELQEKLKLALEKPGKERIRDMVKNPLRLTLLCHSWQLQQGELPETKAGLYEWFVDVFYEWNKGKVSVKLNSTQRNELNRALGELAKTAIDQQSSRFRLPEKFVRQFLGDADECSLFSLALEIGWLNRIGIAEENPLENVYAFFHPTFQEYFAALAINDWSFFLNHFPNNLLHPDASHRIFELHWKEVFLLWLGRSDIREEQKEDFLDQLFEFEDRHANLNFYSNQAVFLAAIGSTEFRYSRSSEVIQCVIAGAFGYFQPENKTWRRFPKPISQAAESILYNVDKKILSTILIKSFPTDQYESWRAACLVRHSFDPVSQENTNYLIQLLVNQHFLVKYEAALCLTQTCFKSQFLIDKLQEILHLEQDVEAQLFIAWTLGRIDTGNLQAIRTLEKLLILDNDEKTCLNIAEKLGDIDPDNPLAVRTAIKFSSLKFGWEIYSRADKVLRKTVVYHSDGIATLSQTSAVVAKIKKEISDGMYQYLGTTPDKLKKIETNIQKRDNSESLVRLLIRGEGNLFEFHIRSILARRLKSLLYQRQDKLVYISSLLSNGKYEKIHSLLISLITEDLLCSAESVVILTDLFEVERNEPIYSAIVNTSKKIIRRDFLSKIVTELGKIFDSTSQRENLYCYQHCYEILWYCSQRLRYSDFYTAWKKSSHEAQHESKTIHDLTA